MPETINIYCPQRWTDIHLLRRALRTIGRDTLLIRDGEAARRIPRGAIWVSWGGVFPYGESLNGGLIRNKFRELVRMREAGVSVPDHFCGPRPRTGGVEGIMGQEPGQWLARSFQHRAARDLLGDVTTPSFWTRRYHCTHEFRIHVFRTVERDTGDIVYRSVRAGLKVQNREDAHPWIRTLKQGWNVDYGTACQERITRTVRDAAKRAVEALDYDFGAVDVGVVQDGTPLVFEVNSAPGLATEATATKYAQHIAARFP